MFNKESRKPTEAAQVPNEGFSERYMGFLTSQCNAHLCDDGIFRNSRGARFCSCDMCGQVSVANFGGEFCIFHLTHHDAPGEAEFFTKRLHHYRDCVVFAKAYSAMRSSEGSLECLQLFYAACATAGIPISFGLDQSPIAMLEGHIEKEWKEEQARRMAGSSKKKIDQGQIMRQKLSNLAESLRMSSPINPTFED